MAESLGIIAILIDGNYFAAASGRPTAGGEMIPAIAQRKKPGNTMDIRE
jgi:hypothetical protein